jgi:hypothetical protein
MIRAKKEALSTLAFNPEVFKRKVQELNEIENSN